MTIIRLVNGTELKVDQTGEAVALKIRREGQVIRLSDHHRNEDISVWVRVAAITSFVGTRPRLSSDSFEVKVEYD